MEDQGLCLLGDCNYKWDIESKEENTILAHLLSEHKIVIASIHTVYDINKYCKYWRNKVKTGNLREHLHGINVHEKEDDSTPELYFMLNDNSTEDKNLRHTIYLAKLESVLAQQQKERECNKFNIQCIFCPDMLKGDRFSLSEHFYNCHSFTLGHPDNLVYTRRFVEELRNKMLHKLECLFCDKTFRDYKTLREHMRKKLHKKLNPKNTEFDKYYIINYREFGKTWKHFSTENNDVEVSPKTGPPDEEHWSDWEDSSPEMKCLVCEVAYTRYRDLTAHMSTLHSINLDNITSNLSYYKQVKLINYFRYHVTAGTCPYCHVTRVPDMTEHIRSAGHSNLDHERYNDDRYLFPALDDDYLLCCLKEEEGREEEDEVCVIPEDISRDFTPPIR